MQANFCPKGYTGPRRTELREYGSSVVLVELPDDSSYREPRDTYTPGLRPAGPESHPYYAYGGGY
ncbi:MAG: hypothetical protein U0931_21395 [Vulcanimicrobiota bacterium]